MRCLFALACLLMPVTAQAAEADWKTALTQLQREDARLQSIGWKLASANAPFCADVQPAIGLLLSDVRNFSNPDPVRRSLELSGDIAVEAAAESSPAQHAGLVAGAEVLSIDGAAMAGLPSVRAPDFTRLAGLHDALDSALASHGSVAIEIAAPDGRRVTHTIAAVPVCRSRFELVDASGHAGADGKVVRIGRGILAQNPDEAQAAALIAHELAHNILRHRVRLAAVGRSNGAIRATEREADRLSVWLLANAAYDPEAAIRFMSGWGAAAGSFVIRRARSRWLESTAGADAG